MTDEVLVHHCAPTLAGIKSGSLFGASFSGRASMTRSVRDYNKRLASKGIRMIPLRYKNGSALLYLYRPVLLEKDLMELDARKLLKERGYRGYTCSYCIREIIRRLNDGSEFPHEIGLFLSYPPEDVRGFIENRAVSCKKCGCWKVYGDEKSAEQTFLRFKNCTDRYMKQWERGLGLELLAVAI